MSETGIERREVLKTGGLIGLAAALPATLAATSAPTSAAAAQAAPMAQAWSPQALPLAFDPKTVLGLSEKLLVSHHDNNYVGAVKRLGAIEAQLAALDPATAPTFTVNGLRREELLAWNSMILHEIYFAQFGTPGRATGPLAAMIERDFGSEARWRAEFTGMGKALGGGSGWVVLTWSRRDRRLMNQWAADHTMALADSVPVLVLDMYEHAYAMDYGAKAAAYVDAAMAAFDWRNAERRFATLPA